MLLFFPKAIYPEINGYRIRAAAMARMLAGRYSCKALLVVPPGEETAASREFLESLGIQVHCIRLKRASTAFRALWGAVRHGLPLQVAAYLDPRVRRFLQREPEGQPVFVSMVRAAGWLKWYRPGPYYMDLIDLIGTGYAEALSHMRPSPMKLFYQLEHPRLRAFEKRVAAGAATTFLVTRHQQEQLQQELGASGIVFLPNGVTTQLNPARPQADYVNWYFLGPLQYHPNLEAMQWFLKEVWPLVRGEVKFRYVGKGGPEAFRDQMREAGMEVFDYVPDLDSVLADYPVCIAPMRSGAGLQNKVLEAMHSGRLVLISSRCATGFPGFVSGKHGFVSEQPEQWTELLPVLKKGGADLQEIRENARDLVRPYHWADISLKLYEALDQV